MQMVFVPKLSQSSNTDVTAYQKKQVNNEQRVSANKNIG